MTINLDELLAAMQKYRDLYWRVREYELQGYLEHYTREYDPDEDDDFDVAKHNRIMELYSEMSRVESELMRLIQGEPTEEAARLSKLLEPYG